MAQAAQASDKAAAGGADGRGLLEVSPARVGDMPQKSMLPMLLQSSPPFTIQQLCIVRAIAETGSFSEAANKLYISQPAVSTAIQNLEKSLQILLFDRSSRRVSLTEAGHLFLRYSERILALSQETCQAVEDLKNLDTGVLVLGASQTIGTYLLPRLIGRFHQKYSKVAVELHVDNSRTVCWNVANGNLDIGVVGGEVPKELKAMVQQTVYLEDEIVLIVPPLHPFKELESISREDLYSLGFVKLNKGNSVQKNQEDTLRKNGISVERLLPVMEFNSLEAIKMAVQNELGAAFVSVIAIEKELSLGLLNQVKIDGVQLRRKLTVITNPNRYFSKAASTFSHEILMWP